MEKSKKAIGIIVTAIMLISVFVAIAPTVSATEAGDLEEIQKAIEGSGAEWQAGYTSVSGLSLEEKQQLCGLKIREPMTILKSDSNTKITKGKVPVKIQNSDSNAATTEGLYPEEPGLPAAVPGEVITSWAASNPYSWGVGFDGSDVWISDISGYYGGTNMDYEYTVGGVVISSFPTPWAGSWPADIAWDGTHLWQVNVAGDNCIYELDPASGAVLGTICDPAGIWDSTSQRGLAYDAGTDTFYVGGWNDENVYHIQGPSGANPGAIIDQFHFGAISGLAFSPGGTLWIATNADPDMLYQVDLSTHTVINSFAHPEGGSYNSGGLACNNDGNLWMISQGTNTVYLVEGEEVCDAFDWRDYLGGDWTTSIRDQGPCGSCWAFGSLAAMEAHIDLQEGDPTFNQDLSEQQLLSCSPGDCGGWYEDAVLDWLRDYGTVDEACFPYQADDTIPCSDHCPDWESRIWKITDWGWVAHTIPAITGRLHDAPLVTGMAVYEDFRYYTGGIYEHVSGPLLGYHLVSMVGYDECEDYWICKNSWGTDWGEEGWFRIRYGQCFIEDMNAYIEPPIIHNGDCSVSIEDASAPQGGTVTVPINIAGVENMCGANIWLNYNKDVVIVDSVSDGDLVPLTYSIDNTAGVTKITWDTTSGMTGDFVFAYVTLKAVGNTGDTSLLDLDVKELYDCDLVEIPRTVVDGTFEVIPPLMEGDVTDLNVCVSLKDSTLIKFYLVDMATLTPDQQECADTNDDGEVTLKDSTAIKLWLVDLYPLWQSPADDHMMEPVPCSAESMARSTASTTVSIEDTSAPQGGTVTVPINIAGVENMCGASIWLNYNKNAVTVDSVSDGDLVPLTYNIDNPAGVTKMTWDTTSGMTGDFVLAYLTLKAVGNPGDTCLLDIDVKELYDCDLVEIPRTVAGGTFTGRVNIKDTHT